MAHFRKGLWYGAFWLMLVTIWALGYARQCDDKLYLAQHAPASPELQAAAEAMQDMEEMQETATTMPAAAAAAATALEAQPLD
jgi:hypothetical protein